MSVIIFDLSLSFWLLQILNGLQLAMLLFLLSLGLTIILGLMNFVNLAHGSLYGFGALFAYSLAEFFGFYALAYILAPIAVMILGALLYILLIEHLSSKGPMVQVLATFGLIFIFSDIQKFLWGADQLGINSYPFSGSVLLFGETYPLYRLLIILCGFLVFVALHFSLKFSRLGIEVRAAVEDSELAASVGISVRKVFFIVFLLGCGLAGFAGAVALPIFSASAGMGVDVLIAALVIVVVGGLGSLHGAFLGSIAVGMVSILGQVLFPSFAGVLLYGLAVAILLFRPEGLAPVVSK